MASQKEPEDHKYDFLTPLNTIGDIDLRLPLEMPSHCTCSVHKDIVLCTDLAGDGKTWSLLGRPKPTKHQGAPREPRSSDVVLYPCVHKNSCNATVQLLCRPSPTVPRHQESTDLERGTQHRKARGRSTSLSLSINTHVPQPDSRLEPFWLSGGDVTPRMTITRRDLRADEGEIYGWKSEDDFKSSAVGWPGRLLVLSCTN
ncbi:hypothetical protein X797_012181 [Metarhizium robertsii]|uniref:Uncharacterized protein n=1 Tax=Metarhizium robertsii TaxID=568076 RepID=A0A014PGQ1_9HYPO|nr:hypothetical protein X797_012181 [Metarhizium robertsii]